MAYLDENQLAGEVSGGGLCWGALQLTLCRITPLRMLARVMNDMMMSEPTM